MTQFPNPETVAPHTTPPAMRPFNAPANSGPGRRNRLVPILTGQPSPPRKFLVEDLFEAGSFGLIFGPPGCGKSFLVVDLLCSVAQGIPWMGKKTEKGSVVYVALEGTPERRVDAWKVARKCSTPEAYKTEGTFTLTDPSDVATLIENINERNKSAELPVVLVVIDTLSRAIPGVDENAQHVMSEVVRNVDRICKETDAAVILVHHPAKSNPSEPRGNTVLMGAVDTCLKVSGSQGVRTTQIVKQREGPSGDGFKFRINAVSPSAVAELVTQMVAVSPMKRTATTDDQRVLHELVAYANQAVNSYQRASQGEPSVVPISKREFMKERLTTLYPGISAEAGRKRFDRSLDRLIEGGAIRPGTSPGHICVPLTTDGARDVEEPPVAVVTSIVETF